MTDTPTPAPTGFAAKWQQYTGSVKAATRYLVTFGGGVVMALGLAGVNPDQAKVLVKALTDIGDGLSAFMVTAGPAISAIALAYGSWKASRAQQAKTVAKTSGVLVVALPNAPADMKAAADDDKKPGIVASVPNPDDASTVIVPKE